MTIGYNGRHCEARSNPTRITINLRIKIASFLAMTGRFKWPNHKLFVKFLIGITNFWGCTVKAFG